MMKITYKNLAGLSALVISVGFLAPDFSVLAQTQPKESVQAFCARLSDTETKINQKIDGQEAQFIGVYNAKIRNLVNLREQRDSQKLSATLVWDARRQSYFDQLRSRAKTDAQKTAVNNYVSAIIDAVNTRKSAISVELQAWRQEIDNINLTRHDAVESAVGAFRTVIQSAFAKAKVNCGYNVDPRPELQTTLKAGKDQFVASRQAIEKLSDPLSGFRQQRKTAAAKALSDYQAAIAIARATLKKALP